MIRIFDTPEALLPALADFIVLQAREAIAQHGRFSFVLSGGGSPKRLFELLAGEHYRGQIQWDNVFFFFGDERYVPATHPDSNYLMAKKALFDPLNIPASQVFRMDTDLSPAAGAQAYEQAIRTYFSHGPVRFDFVLLGLGDNSHTASLFPHTSVLHEQSALVKEIYVDEVGMYRITLTAPVINRAAHIVFLVYGVGKAEAVRHIIEDSRNIELYPAQLIEPKDGTLYWFLDGPAASKLEKRP